MRDEAEYRCDSKRGEGEVGAGSGASPSYWADLGAKIVHPWTHSTKTIWPETANIGQQNGCFVHL